MSLTRNDCIVLLSELSDNGVDISNVQKDLISTPGISANVIKFINDHKQFDIAVFYNNIRKNSNSGKSKLYKNIVKEIDNPADVLTTLSSLLLQILLFSNKLENNKMFLKHARADEIAKVLTLYFTNFDLTNCLKLLHLIKADLKFFEHIKSESI